MPPPESPVAPNDFFMRSGAFLVGAPAPASIGTPEDLGAEHAAIARTVDEFWARDVAPRLESLRRHEPGVGRELVRKAASLGLVAMQIPEAFGGLDLDLRSVILAVEHLAKDASYLGWHLGQSGIGSLPLVYFGTDDQKHRYLPRLASAEIIGAYALTEPHAGSDALSARTRADLSPDGRHFVLNGQKAWITNGGEADLFTVFAKVGGQAFTAFLVERAFGVRSGPEEHKMGITGTSTTPLYFDHVSVPVENVLGEIGRGHIVALNVLNVGRLEIGPLAVGGAREILSASIGYTRERRAFGRAIAEYGAIQRKLAECAVGIYMTESATWRVVELVESYQPASSPLHLAGFQEFAAECAIIKVFASEMLDAVADEGVQMHGGYGYHRDYFVERAYRDARINRIFEGTNEINRLVIPPLLLKRAERSGLPLIETAARRLRDVSASDMSVTAVASDSSDAVDNAKTVALVLLAAAHGRHGGELKEQQEVTMGIADAIIDTFILESGVLRSQKLAAAGRAGLSREMCAVHARAVMSRLSETANEVLPSVMSGSELDRTLASVRALTRCAPFDVIAARQRIAASL